MLARRFSVIAVALLALSACGEEDKSSTEPRFTKDNITQLTTAAMVAEGSAHLEMTIEARDGFITMEGDQALGKDFDATTASFDYAEFSSADEPDTQISITIVDGLIYADLGEASNGKYVRVDPTDSTSELGRVFSPLIEELDLSQSISKFADAITDVKQSGAGKKIDGVRTTPFVVRIDVDKAVASGALDEDTQLRPGATIEYTFYIDADNLMRRMESIVDSARIQMDITSFGDPISIEAPPAGEVIDEAELNNAP